MHRKRRLHGYRRRLKSTAGTTMVSVIVAFVVLLLGVSMLMSVLQFAQRATVRAEQLRKNTNKIMEKYYVNDSELQRSVVGQEERTFILTDGTSSFTLDITQYAYSWDENNLYAFSQHTLP